MKPWWKSKTILFNLSTGLLAVGVEGAALADFAPDEWASTVRFILALFVALGNVGLRLVTSQPVKR